MFLRRNRGGRMMILLSVEPEAYVLRSPLSFFKDCHVEVEVEGGYLHFRKRKVIRKPEGGDTLGEVLANRTIKLPENIATSDITASFQEGYLMVRIPIPHVNNNVAGAPQTDNTSRKIPIDGRDPGAIRWVASSD